MDDVLIKSVDCDIRVTVDGEALGDVAAAIAAADRAEAAADRAESIAIKNRVFPTNDAAEALVTTPEFVVALSAESVGDPGIGSYFLEDTEPTHELKLNIGSQWFGYRSRTVTPEVCGANPGGNTSSDAAFERLVDYANQFAAGSSNTGRGLLINCLGNYQLNEEHIFSHSQLTFDFQGRGIINTSSASLTDAHAAITVRPGPTMASGFGIKTTLTANVSRNATTIPVASAAGFAPGDAILITSTAEFWNGHWGAHNSGYATSYKGEMNFIQSISGNIITLAIRMRDSYLWTGAPDPVTHQPWVVNVRKLNLLDDISFLGMRALGTGGGSTHSSANPAGPRAVRADFCRRLVFDRPYLENHPRFAVESSFGFDHKMIAPVIVGRQLSDPSNLPNISVWFTGWIPEGVQGVDVIGGTARWCRRLVDPDASSLNDIDPVTNEQVPTRDVTITGGSSYACVTGPAGHKYDGMTINGHRVNKCQIGVQHRGMNLTMNNVDIDVWDRGLILGVGSSFDEDISTYDEDPTTGYVYVNGGRINSMQKGIYATTSWEDFQISGVNITAPVPFEAFGKRQSNFRANGVRFSGDEGNTCFLSANPKKKNGSYWRFTHCQFVTGTFAIDIAGSGAPPYSGQPLGDPTEDILIENCLFRGFTERYVRFGSGDAPTWGPRLVVKNCNSDGSAPGGVSNSFGADVLEIGNDWVPNIRAQEIAGGAITVPEGLPLGYPLYIRADTVALAPSGDLTDILGGFQGNVITIGTASSSREITVKHGVGNIQCGADIVLDSVFDSVTLLKVTALAWAVIATHNNA